VQFRLSTILFLVVLLAVSFAWHLERSRNDQTDITGKWHYPTPDVSILGYWETLTIRKDGTFTKHQQHRTFSETYNGEYSYGKNGVFSFHIICKETDADAMRDDDIDLLFRCRCAKDNRNNLLIKCLYGVSVGRDHSPVTNLDGFPIEWHSYTSMSRDEQRDAQLEMVQEVFDSPE